MSEYLTNGNTAQEGLKKLVKDLHAGLPLEAARERFAKMIKGVDASGIAAMEQSLIDEGFPVEEIQRLCDVHAAVFEKALVRPSFSWAGGRAGRLARMPGHPVHTYKAENREAERIIKSAAAAVKALEGKGGTLANEALAAAIDKLGAYEFHLRRKENQLFPLLESKGFTGPSKVMWGKDNELRELFKASAEALKAGGSEAARSARKLFAELKGMVFKEEKILFPAALRKLDEADWARVRKGEEEIGFAWVKPGSTYDPMLAFRSARAAGPGPAPLAPKAGEEEGKGIPLSVGELSPEQIDLMLKAIPMDMTFVDENDKVRYYSGSEHRVFPRSPAIIGRDVRDCHPAKSVGTVEKIVASFKRKEKKSAEFWIEMGGRFVHIRYFPVYDAHGAYRGTVEASQDCTEIRALSGQRRLLDWE